MFSREAIRTILVGCVGLVCLAVPASAGAAVLYDQNNNPGGSGTFSIDDGTDANDNQAADDFTVPAGPPWSVGGVEVSGHYDFGSGPVAGVNVFIYTDVAGLPANAPLASFGPGVIPEGGLSNPDFSIELSPPAILIPGTYWISVQAQIDYPANIWDWDNRQMPALGNPAAWRNPGGGSGPAMCADNTWRVRSVAPCLGFLSAPDQMFRICDSACPPPSTPATTPPGNPLSPINPAGNVRKRKCKKKKRTATVAKKKKCKKKK